MPLLLTLLFFLSGACALVYEVAWVRMLADSLGATSYTIGTVLAAFMGGLALGARWVGKRAESNPLRMYAKLEVAIAVSAAVTPLAFMILPAVSRAVYPAFEGHLWALTLLRCALAFVVLIVPTALMGATFPAMAATVAARGKRGWRVGAIYGANTLGAGGGAVLAGFVLIGNLGLRGATWTAAAANLVVGLVAWAVARGSEEVAAERAQIEAEGGVEEEAAPRERNLALVAVAAAGFVSLGFEVLWTRMFSVLFASVTYSFTLMLATFLLGLAVGAPVFGRISDSVRSRLELVGVLQLVAAVAAAAGFLAFGTVKTVTGTTSLAFGGPEWGGYLKSIVRDAAFVMLIPAFIMGGVLPAAARVVSAGPPAGLATRLGRLYAASTLGAMAGSLVTGFLFIPLFGNFAAVSAVLALLAAASGVLLVFRGGRWAPMNRWLAAGAAAACIALLSAQAPRAREALFRKAVLDKASAGGRPVTRVHYEEGASLTVAVVEEIGSHDRTMYTDAFRVAGEGETYEYMRMLAHLPMLLNPDAKRACVIGLGTGTTAGALTHWPLDRVDIAELCPEVARGARYFEKANGGLMKRVNTDGKVRLVFDDGKAYLKSTRNTYDVIVAEPLNPHMSGAAALYCREFYEAAKARLNPGGTVTQWVPLHGVKPEDFRSLFRTFFDVFPQSAVWYFKEAAVLTGCRDRFSIDGRRLKEQFRRPQVLADLLPINLDNVETLLGCFLFGPESAKTYARYAPLITENLPLIEYFRAGRPVSFAERENLDGLAQHREQVTAYLAFPPNIVDGRDISDSDRALFTVIAANIFRGRGEFIQARLLEMDAERVRMVNVREASRLYESAFEKLKHAAEMAKDDRYIRARLDVYEKSTAPPTEDIRVTPEMAQRLPAMIKGTSREKKLACKWLAVLADSMTLGAVRDLASDSDVEVRVAAVEALGEIGKAEAQASDTMRPLALDIIENVLLRGREEETVLLVAIEACYKIGPAAARTAAAVFPTKAGMGCQSIVVREAAVAAIARMKSEQANPFLLWALDDPTPKVRERAVVAIANTSDPAFVPALLDVLKDGQSSVVAAAVRGLQMLTGVGMQWSASADSTVRDDCRKQWEAWYDDYRIRLETMDRYLRMEPSALADLITLRLSKRKPDEQQLWTESAALLAAFADPAKTPDPVAFLPEFEPFVTLLAMAADDLDLWFALSAFEQKVALKRGVPVPTRQAPR